jgi:prophage antirepressor-like protein
MSEQQAAVQAFEFEQRAVRVEVFDGEPWWVAKDILAALGYAEGYNPSRAIEHVPEEWRGVHPIHTPGGVQEILCLSEQGLYFFLARSDKPMALPFQKWVAGEVLPRIRKTGQYAVAGRPKSQIELLLESVQILADQARLTAALAQRVDAIEAREDARAAVGEQALRGLPAPELPAPELTERMQINQVVRGFCQLTGADYRETWNRLYREVRDRCHLDLKRRADRAEMSVLDLAEQLDAGEHPGLMRQVYAIAFELFAAGPGAIVTRGRR